MIATRKEVKSELERGMYEWDSYSSNVWYSINIISQFSLV